MPYRSFLAILALASLTCAPMPGIAAEEPSEATVDEIVVVAHKHERSIRDVAAHVTVMSRDEITANLATSVADVFRYSPGIDYEAAGSRFGHEGINIRGIGGNRVALLVDGVPLSDQFDVGSFSNATRDFINAGLVERLEVLHGPSSALYGSAAIGGVVAVRTPDPGDIMGVGRTGGDLLATWRGADGSLHGNGLFAFGDAGKGILVGASLRDGQETRSAATDEPFDLRDYRRRSALAKFVADDSGGRTWRLGVIHQDAEVHSDLNSMLGSGRYRSTTALEGEDEYNMDLAYGELEFGGPGSLFDAGVLRGYYEVADVSQKTLDERAAARTAVAIDRYFSFEQQIHGFELNLQKALHGERLSHQLGLGIEYRARKTEEYRDGLSRNLVDGTETNVILGEVFPLRDFPVSESSEWGAYVEDAISAGDWTVIAAVRADRYELTPQPDPMFAEDYPFAEPVSLEDSDLSPKLGLVYHAGAEMDIYLQYAHGFRAPPYEDANIGLEIPFFNYRAVPNPDLESERSNGVEVGVRWRGLKSDLRLAAFRTQYDDFIESKVRIGTDPVSGRVLFQSQNLSRATIEGIEGGFRLATQTAAGEFGTDGSFYVARGENGDNGEPLNSVGPAQMVLGAGWAAQDGRRRLRLQATLTESWNNLDETGGELFEPPGYGVIDLYATQRLSERMTLRAGLLNLTDKTYWVWSDIRGLSADDPVIPYLAQAGRTLTVSLNVNW